jgi:hypothetical protein
MRYTSQQSLNEQHHQAFKCSSSTKAGQVQLTEVKPFAHDRERELRLWQATNELLEAAK